MINKENLRRYCCEDYFKAKGTVGNESEAD